MTPTYKKKVTGLLDKDSEHYKREMEKSQRAEERGKAHMKHVMQVK